MIAWEILDSATMPGDTGIVRLYRRGHEYSIRVDGRELMGSGVHGSEDALATMAWDRIKPRANAAMLIGGLGMGYTLAAALKVVDDDTQVHVAEVVPAVVKWNRDILGALAGNPVSDPRVTIHEGDVTLMLGRKHTAGRPAEWDAILLDVDNGPRALSRKDNQWLYSPQGLSALRLSLAPNGLLAVWSAASDKSFSSRLQRADFQVEEIQVRARGERGGPKHFLWLARI